MNFCSKIERARGFWEHRIVDQLWILAPIPDCVYLWILGPKRILDHRSSSALVGMLITSLLFSNEAHLNSGVRLLLELYCVVIVIKHVAFVTLWVSQLCFRMWLWFRNWKKILSDRRIWRKKGTDRQICISLFTPLVKASTTIRCVFLFRPRRRN